MVAQESGKIRKFQKPIAIKLKAADNTGKKPEIHATTTKLKYL
jgi:hypothetical protein